VSLAGPRSSVDAGIYTLKLVVVILVVPARGRPRCWERLVLVGRRWFCYHEVMVGPLLVPSANAPHIGLIPLTFSESDTELHHPRLTSRRTTVLASLVSGGQKAGRGRSRGARWGWRWGSVVSWCCCPAVSAGRHSQSVVEGLLSAELSHLVGHLNGIAAK
jgi:hypothetical protein